jgi:hypothetical protein
LTQGGTSSPARAATTRRPRGAPLLTRPRGPAETARSETWRPRWDEGGERRAGAEASGWNERARWPGLGTGAATACTREAAIGTRGGWGCAAAPREGKGMKGRRRRGSERRRDGSGGSAGGGGGRTDGTNKEKWGVLWGYGAFFALGRTRRELGWAVNGLKNRSVFVEIGEISSDRF